MLRLLLGFLFLITLQPAMAQGNKDFDEYLRRQKQQFQRHVETKQSEFDEFRRKKNEEFAKLLAKPWQEHRLKDAVKPPVEKEVKPVIFQKREERIHQEIKGDVVPIKKTSPQPQPTPEDPIVKNDEAQEYSTFSFYGTTMKVRWEDIPKFKLSGTNEKAVANAYIELTSTKYNNLLSDCLALRNDYNLCDWAYFQMLKKLSEAACGKDTNEAVFLQGFLYQESGYLIRYAVSPKTNKLHLLVQINGYAINSSFYIVGKDIYYLFDGCNEKSLKITDYNKPKGKEMRMEIEKLPKLKVVLSSPKRIKAQSYPITVSTQVNKNLIDFFNDYPSTYCNDNIMTRWAYYANTPLSAEVKNSIYPILRGKIANATPESAVNMLLDWIQPPYDDKMQTTETQIGFPYVYDDIQWGYDRAFFAEETIYYPGSDCEDHAILFSHLVRDLLGLDVVLVYYPGHLATAICFNDTVKGDFLMVNNRKFIVADPTYGGAPVGATMPSCQGKETKVIICNRL